MSDDSHVLFAKPATWSMSKSAAHTEMGAIDWKAMMLMPIKRTAHTTETTARRFRDVIGASLSRTS